MPFNESYGDRCTSQGRPRCRSCNDALSTGVRRGVRGRRSSDPVEGTDLAGLVVGLRAPVHRSALSYEVVSVPARTFVDSAGAVWEVFEVQRSSVKAQAVSAGLERGWLAFLSGTHKRRLAPFPKDWQTADSAELERLCGAARAAPPPRVPVGDAPPDASRDTPRDATDTVAETASVGVRSRVPRIRASRQVRAPLEELPIASTVTSADPVEGTVRAFGHQARAAGLPAIAAMIQLKALLSRVYSDSGSIARDVRAVRRWFVEAYYFDREVAPVDAGDQSL
jgi:hypothetical protein